MPRYVEEIVEMPMDIKKAVQKPEKIVKKVVEMPVQIKPGTAAEANFKMAEISRKRREQDANAAGHLDSLG